MISAFVIRFLESIISKPATGKATANGRVTDSKILCPFVSVCMRYMSVPHAANASHVR